MPETEAIYEGSNCLIVIEEYVRGKTVAALLEEGLFPEAEAVRIVKSICGILSQLHSLSTPIVHRDIKPSNIIITPEGDVYLADMNVAKWYDPQETEDTRFLGTRCFAAPEQAGYGLTASSDRTDIYAVGILLNVMLTGKYPKEQKAAGRVWNIIERCISLEARDRFSARGLIEALDELEGKKVEEKTDT
jgi:serine/threonine protein kinase